MSTHVLPESYIDIRVAKKFKEENSEKIFTGIVKSYDAESKLFGVEYDDGDTEDMEYHELKVTLLLKCCAFTVIYNSF